MKDIRNNPRLDDDGVEVAFAQEQAREEANRILQRFEHEPGFRRRVMQELARRELATMPSQERNIMDDNDGDL